MNNNMDKTYRKKKITKKVHLANLEVPAPSQFVVAHWSCAVFQPRAIRRSKFEFCPRPAAPLQERAQAPLAAWSPQDRAKRRSPPWRPAAGPHGLWLKITRNKLSEEPFFWGIKSSILKLPQVFSSLSTGQGRCCPRAGCEEWCHAGTRPPGRGANTRAQWTPCPERLGQLPSKKTVWRKLGLRQGSFLPFQIYQNITK